MFFSGIQKITLLDYPGKIATTVFTYGCNFRCPFCHNPELVTEPLQEVHKIPEDYILDFLKSRIGKIDALCITGGEPLLHKDLFEFVKKIKDLGFLVKMDTNGSFPKEIQRYLDAGIVDYWAMDVKNSVEEYLETIGLVSNVVPNVNSKSIMKNIKKSISLIKNSGADYEFRATVVPGLHNEKSFEGIGELVKDSRKFYIQNFRSGKTLDKSYSDKRSFSPQELEKFKEILEKYVEKVEIRGI